MNLLVIATCKMNMRRYPTNPNTTADNQIIVQSLCTVINTRKKKNRKKSQKRLRLCRAPWSFCFSYHP